LEREAEPAWRENCARYERDAEAAAAKKDAWKTAVRNAATQNTNPPPRPAEATAPPAPPQPRLLVMNISIEALQRMLAENPRGLLSVRDELSGWLASFGEYKSAGPGADLAFYLQCWNGDAYASDRVKFNGSPIRIEHAALAILGGLVPDRLREVLADADDGLAARLLYVWPDPVPIGPLTDRGGIETARRRDLLLTAARQLRGLEMGADAYGVAAPRALRLDADAFRLFDEIRRDAMEKARVLPGLAAGWHGKNPGRALRLAMIFEFLEWTARGGAEPTTVTSESMVRAGGYLDYATAMLDRVQGGVAIGRAEADAASIAKHILTRAISTINEREFYRTAGFSWARDDGRRRAAFALLSSMNWIRKPIADSHGRPRGDWAVSPLLARGRQ
jgi:hypothetical protein